MPDLNKNQFRILTAAILILGAGWMAISANLPGGTDTPGIPAPKAGFLAPDFTLTTLQGETITLSDLRGRAVIVNVWASWCGPVPGGDASSGGGLPGIRRGGSGTAGGECHQPGQF